MNNRHMENVQDKRSSRVISIACSVVCVLLLLPLSEAPAHNNGTSGTRPFFQAPYPCGQRWEAKTYESHSPDPDSIDLSEFDNQGNNTSEGHAVLASAAGTVLKTEDTGDSGGWGVVLDHGNGWVTANSYHMEGDSPWPISVGQKVAQGEMLGRTSNTGATTVFHQHYTQLDHYHMGTSDKNAVRVKFNGASISTHAGADPDTWDDGEEIISQNCAGNTFMGWHNAGIRYHLIYKPSTGLTKIVRMNANGSVTTTFEDNWSKGWTHFMPFHGFSGHPHALVYKQATGEAKYLRLGLNGESVTTLTQQQWTTSWTHFVPFSKDGDRYFLAYDSVHGRAKINRIFNTSDGASNMYSANWVKGRTAIVPYTQGPNQYMLLYKGGDGEAKIIRLDGMGNNISPSTVWSDTWSTGYTTFVPIVHEGGRYMFGYKAETGFAKIVKFNSNGQGVSSIKSMNWTKSWTAFSPYSANGDGHMLVYKIGTGQVKTLRLKPGADDFDTLWSGNWTLGWT